MSALTELNLLKTLKELQIYPVETLDDIFKQSQDKGVSFSQLLLDREIIKDEDLGKIQADLVQLQFVNLRKMLIPRIVAEIVPEEFSRRHFILPFDVTEKDIHIASSGIIPAEIIKYIEKKTSLKVRSFYATVADIEDAFSVYRTPVVEEFDKKLSGDDGVSVLISRGYDMRASDIHIEPNINDCVVRFRIDGILKDISAISKEQSEQLINKIKVASKLRTDEHMSAQDGKLQLKLKNELVDIRVSIVPFVEGEKAVLRLLSERSRHHTLETIGLSDTDISKVRTWMAKPYGMILSTGPTGSGKTTTIYSILKILNVREKNISTIEDPVEYNLEGVNQIQVNPKTNLTFAQGLKSLLRQDPDTIFVGEIRDEDTASVSVNSAMTGHLVLSTLHTNDASTTFLRLIDMGVPPYLVASTVNIVVAQRLVRKICDICKISIDTKISELSEIYSPNFIKDHFGAVDHFRTYAGKGCPVCRNTGFVGRVGIFEILEVDDEIRYLVKNNADSSAIKAAAVKKGMTSMLEDGLKKVMLGQTTISELMRVSSE
jgi:type II secretory ATPase GspE/PulE/Tfp pilus assembly ATPase PilB-like protein